VWSFAFLRIGNFPLLNSISAAARRRLQHAEPTSLANSAWAVAVMYCSDVPFIEAISAQSRRKITASCGSLQCSSTAWAMSYITFVDMPLLAAIASASIRLVASTTERTFMASTAWACATMVFESLPLLDAISAAALKMQDDFRPNDFATLARALWLLTLWPRHHSQSWSDMRSPGLMALSAKHPNQAPDARRCTGKIVDIKKGGTRGFIRSDEVNQEGPRSKSILLEPVGNLKLGAAVSFRMFMRFDGFSQAFDVEEVRAQIGAGCDVAPAIAEKTCVPSAAPVRLSANEREDLARRGFILRNVGQVEDASTLPQMGSRVCISYSGRLATDGTFFDAAESFNFTLGAGSVIAGLDKGLAAMSVGQEAELIVHHSHAYGDLGAPLAPRPVPPRADLVFHLRLLAVEPGGCIAEEGAGGTAESGGGTGGAEDVDRAVATRPAAGLSVKAWLLAIDEKGSLLEYERKMVKDFDNAAQIVSVYARERPDGSLTVEPEFFDDVGVSKAGHRRLFEQWFSDVRG